MILEKFPQYRNSSATSLYKKNFYDQKDMRSATVLALHLIKRFFRNDFNGEELPDVDSTLLQDIEIFANQGNGHIFKFLSMAYEKGWSVDANTAKSLKFLMLAIKVGARVSEKRINKLRDTLTIQEFDLVKKVVAEKFLTLQENQTFYTKSNAWCTNRYSAQEARFLYCRQWSTFEHLACAQSLSPNISEYLSSKAYQDCRIGHAIWLGPLRGKKIYRKKMDHR